MTYQDAYLDGFCKAAEAAGVDPVALYKRAGIKDRLAGLAGRAVGTLGRAGTATKNTANSALNRFVELLRGGNAEKIERMHRGGIGDGVLARNLFKPLASGGSTAAVPRDAAEANAVIRAKLLDPLRRRINAIRGRSSFDRDVVSEARKALGVQLGTAAGGAMAAGATGYALGNRGQN